MASRRFDVPPAPEQGSKPGAQLLPGDAVIVPGFGTIPVLAAVPFDQAPRRITPVQTLVVLAWGDLALLSRPGQVWDVLIPTDPARRGGLITPPLSVA